MINKLLKEKTSNEQNINNGFTLFIHFLYIYFGKKLLKKKGFRKFFEKNIYNAKYENILKQSNLKILPEEYFLSIYISMVLIIILVLVLSIIVLFYDKILSILIFYGGILVMVFVGIFMYNYPIALAKQRGAEIDASMPYLLPYMKILSKELNLAKIVDVVEEFLIYKEIREEFRKIKYYSNFLGYDIHSSIREAMMSCPSRELSDLMNDLVTISNSGGDIYTYLERKLSNLEDELSAKEKKNIETLLIFSQIYVVLLLVSPLFFTIMSTILNLIDFNNISQSAASSMSTTSDTTMVIVMLLFGLPIAYGFFMILIYYSKPLYSRLKPIYK